MKLMRKLFFYGIGVLLGLLATWFMFGDRTDIQCSYFPNERVLYDLRKKKLEIGNDLNRRLVCNGIDSTALGNLLWNGEVLFEESTVNGTDSCNVYVVQAPGDKPYKLSFRNCTHRTEIISAEGLTPCP